MVLTAQSSQGRRAMQVTHEAAAEGEAEALDSYVLVGREDVLEAVGAFIAAYLASLPEAQNLQPAQLQSALKQAFQARPALQGVACSKRRCLRMPSGQAGDDAARAAAVRPSAGLPGMPHLL